MAFNIVPATSPAFQAPTTMDWSNPMGGLGQDIMDYLKNNQVPSTTPEGKWGAGQAQIGINGAGMYVLPGGDASFGTPGYGVVSGGQGGGYYYKPLNGNETNAANYSYNPDGSYNHTDYNSHIMSPAQGVASVIGAGLGFGAIGAMAGGAAAGAGTGAATGADMSAMYGGLDGGATLGGGSSVAGGSALGGVGSFVPSTGGLSAGVGGLSPGADLEAFYGGLDNGATLGGGASVNGGAALGAGALDGVTPPNPFTNGPPPTGTPPPANPLANGGSSVPTTTTSALQNVMNGTASTADWLKLGIGATSLIGGAAAGSQGVQNKTSQTLSLDPRLDSAVYGNLIPGVQSTMGSQMPVANAAGQQLMSVGSGLLGTSNTPNFANNPYLSAAADDMSRRTQQLLGTNNLAIQGNAVATGGLGGSRQGVAQGVAAGQAADSLQGQLANLYQTQYNTDATRALQQQAIGAGMIAQGQQAPWVPLSNANSIFGNFKSGNSTTVNSQGGGATGALGGLLGGAQYAQNAGLFGGGGTQSTAWW